MGDAKREASEFVDRGERETGAELKSVQMVGDQRRVVCAKQKVHILESGHEVAAAPRKGRMVWSALRK